MKLGSDQLVLDTNILVHWLRGKDAGEKLRTDYALGNRTPRPILPLVVKAEIKSLALQFGWGPEKNKSLDELLRELPIAEISSEPVIGAYASLADSTRSISCGPERATRSRFQAATCSECRLGPFFAVAMLRKLMLEQVAANGGDVE